MRAAVLAFATLLTPGRGVAGVALRLRAEALSDASGPAVALSAANGSDAAVRDVVPHVVWERRTFDGEAVPLAPGDEHRWRFALPQPGGPGRFPVTIRVAYRDAGGTAWSTPVVTVVATAGALETGVRLALHLDPVAGLGNGRVLLQNDETRPVAGRLAFVLPAGLQTDPESEPAEVPAGESASVPLIVEDHGAPRAAGLPAYAVFEYTLDGVHHTAVGEGNVAVIGGGRRGVTALTVGVLALAVALGVLGVALRAARRRS